MALPADVVTLENYAFKMPSWAPDLPSHLYALVDMGSNGIRFSVSDLSPPKSRLLKCLYRERAAISLFDALSESASNGSSRFSQEVITRVTHTLARFKSIADHYGVPPGQMSVFATEAMRKAENASSMLEAILAESGLGVHVLAPEVEVLFGAMGARSAFDAVNGLLLDLGGGSVQMTYMNSNLDDYETNAAKNGKSLPFGATKLMSVLETGDSYACVTATNELKAGMQDAFAKLRQHFSTLAETQSGPDVQGVDVYLCGGGFRGYGSILMHNDPIEPYPIPAVGAYSVDSSFFKQTIEMRTCNEEQDGKIFGMSKRRRQQFPAIVDVVEALISAVPHIGTVTFCSGGNREGVLLLKLPLKIREARPLPLLCQLDDPITPIISKSVIEKLQSALPKNFDVSRVPSVVTLGLGSLFVSKIWTRTGEAGESNAASELHDAVTRDPSVPGFTHLARAVLGLSLCFRWGATLGAIDQHLFGNLRKLIERADPDAVFWAEYMGAVAKLMTQIFPVAPQKPQHIDETVQLNAAIISGKNKTRLQLVISLSPSAGRALESHDLSSPFKLVGKHQSDTEKSRRKIEVLVQKIQ